MNVHIIIISLACTTLSLQLPLSVYSPNFLNRSPEPEKMIIKSIQWLHPLTNILVGPSNSGKTTLISSILENKNTLFKQSNLKTILYFNQEQEI